MGIKHVVIEEPLLNSNNVVIEEPLVYLDEIQYPCV
jgi:hypothetical protein